MPVIDTSTLDSVWLSLAGDTTASRRPPWCLKHRGGLAVQRRPSCDDGSRWQPELTEPFKTFVKLSCDVQAIRNTAKQTGGSKPETRVYLEARYTRDRPEVVRVATASAGNYSEHLTALVPLSTAVGFLWAMPRRTLREDGS